MILRSSATRFSALAEARDRNEIVAVQDEIVRAVVSIIVARVGRAESERVSRKMLSSWNAYDQARPGCNASAKRLAPARLLSIDGLLQQNRSEADVSDRRCSGQLWGQERTQGAPRT